MEQQAGKQPIDCVKIAKDMFDLVRKNAAEIEEKRRLTDAVLDALQQSGMYSVNVPDEFGGTSPSPRAQCEAIEELSRADGSVGWCFMVSTGFNWQVGHDFGSQAMDEAFADISKHVAGSFMPSVMAKPVDGGYIINGQSKYNSNVYGSGFKFVNAMIQDPSKPANIKAGEMPEIRAMLVPDADCEIVDIWNVLGLRGSGSNDVRIVNKFVPAHRTINVTESIHKPESALNSPIYRLPYIPWTAFHTAAVAVGIAQAAYEHFVRHVKSKVMLSNKLQSQAAFPSTKFAIADVATSIRAARTHLLMTADECWEIAQSGRAFTLEEQAHMQMAAYHATDVSVRAVQQIFTVCGGGAIFDSNPIQKCLRDVLCVRQHLSVSPDRSLASISRRLLELPLEPHQPFD
ncbi:acyl-CoA dehydrogenase family protein [Pseudomonas sp. J452]|uniref:acyl-CoA dehydrogenase family protein n=1 Tax=Pseudomonas sp. J452 TaxID=2898441 RepID=UPI0021AD9315|nr:acyl-CoA dehydrogenase family protein [Pseudomonas sp. J452]UUY08389.1 acyl-CoA dehydrogenase family protein [Pseudomonas sp. J452]